METFKNVRDSWTLVQDQVEQKRGWLIGETVIGSDPQQCQLKLAGISIRAISGNVEFDMMKISAFSDGVVNDWNNTQPESAISAGDRIISVDGLQGDDELMLNELRTNNKPRKNCFGDAANLFSKCCMMANFNESEFERAMGES